MPTYEYACRSCGQHLEVVQSFKDDALTECPSCHGALRKVFSAAGIIFKGSGWHVKDYATTGTSNAVGTSSNEGGDSSSSSGGSEGGKSGTGGAESSEGTKSGSGGTKTDEGTTSKGTASKRKTAGAATSSTGGGSSSGSVDAKSA